MSGDIFAARHGSCILLAGERFSSWYDKTYGTFRSFRYQFYETDVCSYSQRYSYTVEEDLVGEHASCSRSTAVDRGNRHI